MQRLLLLATMHIVGCPKKNSQRIICLIFIHGLTHTQERHGELKSVSAKAEILERKFRDVKKDNKNPTDARV